MEPLVSIIIPVYNVAHYVREAIESVINQTYGNLEIIIIDDGSTDESGLICDEYDSDPRIRVIHQENKGLSAARNAGLDQMNGDYVGFLDSDDMFCPNMVESLIHELIANQTDIAVCDFHTVYSEMEKERVLSNQSQQKRKIHFDVLEQEEVLQRVYDTSINFAPWNKIYRVSIWKGFRFPEGHVFEGTYTVFDLFDLAKCVSITNEKLIIHRERQGSITDTVSLKNSEDWLLALKNHCSFVEKHSPEIFSSEQIERKWRWYLSEVSNAYINSFGHSEEKWKAFRNDNRRQIIEIKNRNKIKNLGFRMKVVIFLISCFPWLVKPVYRMYHLMR